MQSSGGGGGGGGGEEELVSHFFLLSFLFCNHPADKEKSWLLDFSCLSSLAINLLGKRELVA